MVYVTGDCHGDFSRFFAGNFPKFNEMTKEDYVIVCGDFGIWDHSEKRENDLDALDALPFTVLFVDGNHENFDILDKLPYEWWHGGKVQRIRPSVIRLMRGQCYRICDKTFFTFGGARSHDIDDGILSPKDIRKIKKWMAEDKRFRIDHLTWWEREEPSPEEYEEGLLTLKWMGHKVDYIITHEAPISCIQEMKKYGGYAPSGEYPLTDYLQDIKDETKYKQWYFGHHHTEEALADGCFNIYKRIKLLIP